MNDPIRVFLICRHRLMREVLGDCLEDQAELQLAGESQDFDGEAQQRLQRSQADVVLLDTGLGTRRALDITRQLRTVGSAAEILPFGLDADNVAQVVQLLAAGAASVSLKQASIPELLGNIRQVHRRQPNLGQPVLDAALQRLRCLLTAEPESGAPARVAMTRRELQVLQHMAGGLRNKEIASRLEITVPTIKNHVHNILTKFQVRRRRDAIRCAYESGILEGESPWRSTLRSPV